MIALHLVAIILFIGGLLTTSFMLGSARDGAELRRLRLWNGFVTTPALLIVWAAGIHLALAADWFASLWLQLKLGCVLLLSLVQVWQTYRLATNCAEKPGSATRWLPPIVLFLLSAIFYLVVAKPD